MFRGPTQAHRLLTAWVMAVGTKIKSLFWAPQAPPPVAKPAAPPVTTNDPKADQLLAAFEAMHAALPPAQVQIALLATASAIGADLSSVATTLGQRLAALEASIVAEQQRVTDRKTTRGQQLSTATAKVNADIKTMEDRIATLKKELAAVTEGVAAQHASDREQLTTLEQRTRAEAARLAALRDFIARRTT